MAMDIQFTITNTGVIRQLLKPGTDCYLFHKTGQRYKVHQSIIRDVTESGFSLARPFREDPEVPVTTGRSFIFKVHADNGSVEFTGTVLRVETVAKLPVVWFPFPKKVIRIQRREAYRVATALPSGITLLAGHQDQEGQVEAVILDISLNGALLATDLTLEPGTKGILDFHIPRNAEPLQIEFQIQRVRNMEGLKTRHLNHYGLKFSPLPGAVESILSRYINERQVHSRG